MPPIPVTFLKGVKTGARGPSLAQLGVYTVEDLCNLYPRSYEDRSAVRKISELREGEAATVCAYVRNADTRMQKNRLSITNVRICDETGKCRFPFLTGNIRLPRFGEENSARSTERSAEIPTAST